MIERHGSYQHLVCRCNVTGKMFGLGEFAAMIRSAKDDGWRISKRAGEWEHGCPDCAAATPEHKGSLL